MMPMLVGLLLIAPPHRNIAPAPDMVTVAAATAPLPPPADQDEPQRPPAESPVAEWTNHVTDNAQANGSGKLSLKVDLPLAKLAATRIDGEYTLAGNRLKLPGDGAQPARGEGGGIHRGRIKKLDLDQMRLTLTVGGKDRDFALTEGTQVLDAQGSVVRQALQSLGYENVADVRMGKYIELDLRDGGDVDRQVREMCERLLANPTIENYEFEVLP